MTYQFHILQRYRYIETFAFWEGRVNANHLMDYFGIKRSAAQACLSAYNNEIAPRNLVYDTSIKGFLPTEQFVPILTKGHLQEYASLINEETKICASDITSVPYTHHLPLPTINIDPRIVRIIIQACKQHTRLDVDYRSIAKPDLEGRIIIPHSLIFSGMRWHVRAYCEKSQAFKDFVLSRFFAIPEEMGEADITAQDDTAWQTQVDVIFVPDHRLTPEQKIIVEHDYGMQNGRLLVTTRGPLVQYLMHAMRVDPNIIPTEAHKQQIVVENVAEVKPWCFG